MSAILFTCPDCGGDGKETCHNPDHGFYSMVAFHDEGRIGCPCCGHDPKHKVKNGGACDTCNGAGNVTFGVAKQFCDGCDYDFEDVMSQVDPGFYDKIDRPAPNMAAE